MLSEYLNMVNFSFSFHISLEKMSFKLFFACLAINLLLFFGNICANEKGNKFNEILSDILRVPIDLQETNRSYPIRQDILSNQWMAEIYKNVKIEVEIGRNQFVGQFGLRNFIRKIHSFTLSHIIDIGKEGVNRCMDYDGIVLYSGILNAFSENQGLKPKMDKFVEENEFSEFLELIYSFSIKCESMLEGIPIEGEKGETTEKKLKILIEAYNCMDRQAIDRENGRIFSVKIVPHFESNGTEFSGIIIEWDNSDEREKINEREVNFLTFIEFNRLKLAPRVWLAIARKFARNVFDAVVGVGDRRALVDSIIQVSDGAYDRDLYEDMLVQLIHGHQYINFGCALNFKAGIFGIGVMQKLLDEGSKNGYLAQFQGIGNEIQRAKNMAEKMFKRRSEECTYEISDTNIDYFNIFEAFLHYEDVIGIDWNEQKGQSDEIDDLKRMEPYVEYLQRNETNFKIQIEWIGKVYPYLKNPYSELEEYYEKDKRDFYGVDLVRMYVEKFGIFAKSVPSRIEREFDLWHLVGKMDQELDDFEEWLTRDIFGTELMKKYVQQMEELKENEHISEFYENYGIQKIVENLKENIKNLDEKREEITALHVVQENVQKFAEICKNLSEFQYQWYGIELLVNNLNREIGKFLKITKDREGINKQKMMENEFGKKRKNIIEDMKSTMGKLGKYTTKKWAELTKNKVNYEEGEGSNAKDGKGVKGMENIRKSFQILTQMKNMM